MLSDPVTPVNTIHALHSFLGGPARDEVFDLDLAIRAFRAPSPDPVARADRERRIFEREIVGLRAELAPLAADTERLTLADELVAGYRRYYLQHLHVLLQEKARRVVSAPK